MIARRTIDFWLQAGKILQQFRQGGVLCSVTDKAGQLNLITLGWGLVGPSYHGNPVMAIAVTPERYSWHALEETDTFTIAVPDGRLSAAVAFCGSRSGRDVDKFKATGLTPVAGWQVPTCAVMECPVNLECRTYARVRPPHQLLTPEHRQRPLEKQHTIYFAEVVAAYEWGAQDQPSSGT